MSDKPFVVKDREVMIRDSLIKEASVADLKLGQQMPDASLSRIREQLEDISRSLSDSGLARAISEIDDIPDRVAVLEGRIARLEASVGGESAARADGDVEIMNSLATLERTLNSRLRTIELALSGADGYRRPM